MGFGTRLRALAAASFALGGVMVVIGSIDGPVARAATVSIPAIVRDFDHDPKVNAPNAHPDFEAFLSDDPGIVTDRLGADGKPVYGDHPTGTDTTTSAASFNQWYHDDATVNRSVPITLDFQQEGSQMTFTGDDFFPIDGKGWNDPALGTPGQVDNEHNYSFTMELHMTFTYGTGQQFTFEGDDDVFVYFNKYLGIDLGGVHGTETQSVQLDDIAGTDRANMTAGNTYPLDIFFAERHTSGSNFNVDANFAVAAETTTTTSTSTTTTTIVGQTTTTSTSTTSTSTTSTSTTVPTSTSSTVPPTSTSTSTSTTVRPTTTSTTIAVAGLQRTGSNVGPLTGVGFVLLGSGAVLALVDRSRYKGRHFA